MRPISAFDYFVAFDYLASCDKFPSPLILVLWSLPCRLSIDRPVKISVAKLNTSMTLAGVQLSSEELQTLATGFRSDRNIDMVSATYDDDGVDEGCTWRVDVLLSVTSTTSLRTTEVDQLCSALVPQC